MTDVECPECGKENHRTEIEKQICLNEHFKKILKKWSLATLAIVAIAIPYFMGSVWGQEWQDIQVQVNGQPYLVNLSDPHFVQAEPNSFITGIVHTAGPMTPICSLQGCTPTTVTDSTIGGYDEKFSGEMGNDTTGQQFIFKVLNEQNFPVATIIFMNPPNHHMFERPDNTPNWEKWAGGVLVGLGLIPVGVVIGGTTLGIIATIRHIHNLSRRNRKWRMN
jgi:hypothetical protein